MNEPLTPHLPEHMISEIEKRREAIRLRADAQRREQAATHLLEEMRQIYEATRNPLCPWLAIRYCGKIGWPIPEWVTAYLVRAADGLEKLIDRPPADLRKAVAEILDFRADSKGGNPFWASWQARPPQRIFGQNVAARHQAQTNTAAMNEAAAESNSTIHTVRRRLQYQAETVLGDGADIEALEEQLQWERDLWKALDPGQSK